LDEDNHKHGKMDFRRHPVSNNQIHSSSDEQIIQDSKTVKKLSCGGENFVTNCMEALRKDANSFIKNVENESISDLKDNLRQFRLQYLAQI
jgi:hypothetical protein